MTDNILVQAAAASAFAKVLVDAVKTTPLHTAGWKVLLLAFTFAQGAAFALEMAVGDGVQWTQKDVSTCALVGVMAFGSAVGLTELQKKAEERKAG
ncbi:MAG TPA: hypothetical protein VEB22_06655 [Phycisphaerales bacterium]|nr:hypothetical protein [Phycisphaerales bacterium]